MDRCNGKILVRPSIGMMRHLRRRCRSYRSPQEQRTQYLLVYLTYISDLLVDSVVTWNLSINTLVKWLGRAVELTSSLRN
jgi:hypothetical protein